jgi:spore coat polysaccharide biosynthesis predicted glycosyltransferase SpsG
MQDADLAIGAGGMTSWERCCLGLPTLVIVTAENQGRIVTELARAGAVISLGHASSVHAGTIAAALVALAGDAGRLRDMSASAASLCDGAGVSRVLEALNS